jgi:translation initiation factor eIF-2B subunit delta
MKEVTKVFLGASALMSDGSILSRVGTASVAMMARSHNVPVLVCCETYKISNRVQLESITGNELGDPNSLLHPSKTLEKWKEKNGGNLRLLNLLYDLTPNEFVSGIVTEMGILPPTSVAVLLREMNPQDNGFKAEEQY